MISWKMISRILGFLLYIESLLMLLCSAFGFYFGENDRWPFVISAGISLLVGGVLNYLGREADKRFGRRDGYIIVTFSWIVFSLIGMLPFLLSRHLTSVTDAFFETMSGFTTTGASVLPNIEALPHGLLFWRSMTQWIGGLGIIFFTIAVLPVFGVGGVQLFAAEATGPRHDKVHPRIEVTAKWIWSIYVGLTVICALLFAVGDMEWFDCICHAMCTTATGGFSTRNASIGAFDSAYIEYVTIFFMFISGINFTLLFTTIFKRKVRKLFDDTEFHWYIGLALSFTLLIALGLTIVRGGEFEASFREALFQVVSVQTTTGFVSADYMLWPPILWFLLSVVMYFGACAGSTSGAIKCVRIAMVMKAVRNEFLRIIHPNAIIPLRISGNVIHSKAKITLLAFFMLYALVIFFGWLIMIAIGLDFMDAYGIVVSCVSNVGPALGNYASINSWAPLPDAAKWVSAFLMLIGRLELFSVLLLLTPGFWRKS
ncbi:MAG: TrkH family potassium uptake protein [Bacteroidaceae bacterium]|nr:TrkH family potassium uptake protein [Bacteroidaceae bacterium]